MKILYVASASSIHSFRWIEYFAAAGHDVCWVSFRPLVFTPSVGIRYSELAEPRGSMFLPRVVKAVHQVRALVKEFRPDLVHAHYAGVNGLVAALVGFRPLVVTAWGSDIVLVGRSPIRGHAVRWTLTRADLITCDAEHLRRSMMDMGVGSGKIVRINFGTDLNVFSRREEVRDLRKGLGLNGLPVVISTRNLYRIYNVELLLSAVPGVLARTGAATFLIVGTGPEEDRLRRLAESLGVAARVRFIGRVGQAELAYYLSVADVYVSTALSDGGLAASTAEAMACELPVVVTDIGENGKWVANEENGFLVPTDDPAALADRIAFLLEHEAVRREFGKRNRSVIAERNSFGVEMGKMDAVYHRLLTRSASEH